MSTFDGIVTEFPNIRIDFFRQSSNAAPPLACFLSHIHSDHLAGLESLRSPFVYCSAATREILLRLERYPCRINYANGLLESRVQTYKHLAKVLKPLPLETPTTIELYPGGEIQVTLFDANHCLGAVMFLIEGNGKAILYTGDIRSEPWFVNSLARDPNLVEYTSGLKTLDKIYLDTSFTKDVPFQTKAQGIAELLRKVSQYPKDTIFHIQAWTYGYEDVWIALSKALKSPIHVDDYKLRVYRSLRAKTTGNRFSSETHLAPESPALVGYMCGNAPHPGCLTADKNVGLHSCERGNMCEVAKRSTTVKIQPIIAHLSDGDDLAEIGVGGGGDDLERDVELEYWDQADFSALIEILCSSTDLPDEDRDDLKKYLAQTTSAGRNISLDIDVASFDKNQSVKETVRALIEKLRAASKPRVAKPSLSDQSLPGIIRFPYSRHSSYEELCHLVRIFSPKDIWPCTVSPAEWFKEGVSIRSLFGEWCSGNGFNISFEHDIKMKALFEKLAERQPPTQMETQLTADSVPSLESSPFPPDSFPRSPPRSPSSFPNTSPSSMSTRVPAVSQRMVSLLPETQSVAMDTALTREDSGVSETSAQIELAVSNQILSEDTSENSLTPRPRKRGFSDFSRSECADSQADGQRQAETSFASAPSAPSSASSVCGSAARSDAYLQMIANMNDESWTPIRLISTSTEHTVPELLL